MKTKKTMTKWKQLECLEDFVCSCYGTQFLEELEVNEYVSFTFDELFNNGILTADGFTEPHTILFNEQELQEYFKTFCGKSLVFRIGEYKGNKQIEIHCIHRDNHRHSFPL